MGIWINLDNIDRFLIVLLIVSLLAKPAKNFIIFIFWKKWSEQYKKSGEKCVFLLEKKGKFICDNETYKKKNFVNDRCRKKECKGYRKRIHEVKELMYSNVYHLALYTLVDFLSQLPAVILIIRTLIKIKE